MKKAKLKFGPIAYDKIIEAMIFGQHYKINKKGKWIKTKMSRTEFLRNAFTW